ncbi:MAG: hypothetical protein ABI843_02445 [Dokdonella sp.]
MTRRVRENGDLFDVPRPAAQIPASMDYRPVLAGIVSQMLEQATTAGKDRYAVAAEMSRLAGKEISKYMLDAYSANSREEYNIPAWLMPLLEVACGSYLYSNWLAEVRGGRMMIGRDALAAELGRLERQKGELAREEKAIRERLRRSL